MSPSSAPVVPLTVTLQRGQANQPTFTFDRPFRIGRGARCDVQLYSERVSRVHAEVSFEDGQWWIRDLNTTNGTRVDGSPIGRAPIVGPMSIEFGRGGPCLALDPRPTEMASQSSVSSSPQEPPPPPDDAPPEAAPGDAMPPADEDLYRARYFEGSDSDEHGEHTRLIRRVYRQDRRLRRRKYVAAMMVLGVLVLGAGAYAVHQQRQFVQLRADAADMFYQMKTIELQLADLERGAEMARTRHARAAADAYRTQRYALAQSYERLLAKSDVYADATEEERLIYHIARVFGESEVVMPKAFIHEVQAYIRKWQATERLADSIRRAEQAGFTPMIVETLEAHDLPPQFFYLALQESDFDPRAVGPPTRYGHAKGMWQFIPKTALEYGMRTGPRVNFGVYDPADERHHPRKSTLAAARYLRFLYSTEAQASGLLVMACYNWGEYNVLRFVRRLPQTPAERNFWQMLLAHGRHLPDETYDYVLHIVSAAVIGENPRLFGFDFDNPLAPYRAAADSASSATLPVRN